MELKLLEKQVKELELSNDNVDNSIEKLSREIAAKEDELDAMKLDRTYKTEEKKAIQEVINKIEEILNK